MLEMLAHAPAGFYFNMLVIIALGATALILGFNHQSDCRTLFGVDLKDVTKEIRAKTREAKPEAYRRFLIRTYTLTVSVCGLMAMGLVTAFL